MHIVSNMALISINETLLVQLISFLIFLFVINRLMFRPLRNTMAEREFYLEEMAASIDDAQKKVDRTLAEIKGEEAAVRTEALKLVREHETAGAQEAHRMIEAARSEIGQLRRQTEGQVAAQIAEARKTIRAESEVLAASIMEKVLERRLIS